MNSLYHAVSQEAARLSNHGEVWRWKVREVLLVSSDIGQLDTLRNK